MVWITVTQSHRFSFDGITNKLLEAGEDYEVSVRCAEVFEAEGWGKIIPAPEVEEVEDDDASTDGEGNGSDNEGSESDDDSGDGEDQDDDSGNGSNSDDDSGSGGEESTSSDDEDDEEDDPVATPAAVALAGENDLDLAKIEGTGTDGTITVDDVRKAVKA